MPVQFYERVAHLPCNFFFDDDYLTQMVEALRDGSKFAISMANHSFLMTGKTVEEAYLRAVRARAERWSCVIAARRHPITQRHSHWAAPHPLSRAAPTEPRRTH